MAMERGNAERILQIARCLAVKFPTPYPTTVQVTKKIACLPGASAMERRIGDMGYVNREGRKLVIRIAVRPGLKRQAMIDTLMHEWAHAVTWRQANMESLRGQGHDDEWALMLGRIYRWFVDEGGHLESHSY